MYRPTLYLPKLPSRQAIFPTHMKPQHHSLSKLVQFDIQGLEQKIPMEDLHSNNIISSTSWEQPTSHETFLSVIDRLHIYTLNICQRRYFSIPVTIILEGLPKIIITILYCRVLRWRRFRLKYNIKFCNLYWKIIVYCEFSSFCWWI